MCQAVGHTTDYKLELIVDYKPAYLVVPGPDHTPWRAGDWGAAHWPALVLVVLGGRHGRLLIAALFLRAARLLRLCFGDLVLLKIR